MNVKSKSNVAVKTFFQVSRPRPRPWTLGLEIETKTLAIRSRDRDRDRDLDKMNSSLETMVSRSQHWLHQFRLMIENSLKGATNYGNRRHQACCLETKNETLHFRSRDQDRDLGLQVQCNFRYEN